MFKVKISYKPKSVTDFIPLKISITDTSPFGKQKIIFPTSSPCSACKFVCKANKNIINYNHLSDAQQTQLRMSVCISKRPKPQIRRKFYEYKRRKIKIANTAVQSRYLLTFHKLQRQRNKSLICYPLYQTIPVTGFHGTNKLIINHKIVYYRTENQLAIVSMNENGESIARKINFFSSVKIFDSHYLFSLLGKYFLN